MKMPNKIKFSFFEKASGILGINARNLLYIGRYNTRANKKFADDKLFTKNYLGSRGLSVAKVFTVIKNYKELKQFNPDSLPETFVIKPNRGYGGEGILIIKEHKKTLFTDMDGVNYIWKDIYRHMISILDGKYAISGLNDQIIIEEMLIPHEYFRRFTSAGLPDVRIIVFNYIPIIAMLRLPTEESSGKANLHLGAVGVGININSGKANHAVYKDKFINHLPNGESIHNITVPFWDEALLTASRAQHASQIGFLAVDLAITTTGLKILELNARAGLAVQIANQTLLKARLKKVADLNVPTPEKGVEISKTLFGVNLTNDENKESKTKPVIGLYEYAGLLNTKLDNLLFKIDPHANEAVLDQKIAFDNKLNRLLEIKIKNQRLTIPYITADLSAKNYQGILPGKYLQDFLIDISLDSQTKKSKTNKKKNEVDEKIIQNIDKKIFKIESKINIVGALRPTNLDKAKKDFFIHPTFSPRFFYRHSLGDLASLRREINNLPNDFEHPFEKLYKKKIKELNLKLNLLEAINSSQLQVLSEQLYGKADRVLYDKAVRYIHDHPIVPDESQLINHKSIIKKIEMFLKNAKLSKWKIVDSVNRATDIAVNKNDTIFLHQDASFSENRLRAIIAHEIATHIYRLENGSLQKYKILEKGTAFYLATEEGLAIYNQKQLNIPLGEKDIWPALRTIGAYLGDEMSFAELFNYLKENYGLSDESAWTTCVKAKRGLVDTSKKISFTRDTIYFRGYLQVNDFLKRNGANGLRQLYIGKIGLNDLELIPDIKDYKTRYLPNYQNILEV